MKVKMLVAFDRTENPFAVGQIVDVPEQTGVLYIQAGYAVAVQGEQHPDPDAPAPVAVVEVIAPEPEPEPEPITQPEPPVSRAAGKPKD
jgi:hypothetical protein